MSNNYLENETNISYLKYLMVSVSIIILIVLSIILYSFNFGLLGLFFSLVVAYIESVLIIKTFMNFSFSDLIFKFYLGFGILSLVVILLLVN